MASPAAQLRKANSSRGYLHPFKSFSTSRLRVEPSPDLDKTKKEGAAGAKQGFFSQLKRSFTIGHRSSSSTADDSIAHKPAVLKGDALPAAAAAAEPSPSRWGRRVKHGISKPLKAVTESYMGCMMKISEDGRFEEGGFQNPNQEVNAFRVSASRHQHDDSDFPPLSASARDKVLHGVALPS